LPRSTIVSGSFGDTGPEAALTQEAYAALQTVVPSINDPELRARVADLLWLTTHDYRAGELAVDAYLDSATRLAPDPR